MELNTRFTNFQKTASFRVLLHVGFWVLYLSIPIWQYIELLHASNFIVLILFLINLLFVPCYYLFAYVIVDKFFTAHRVIFFITCTLALYALLFYAIGWLEPIAQKYGSDTDKPFFDKMFDRHIFSFATFLQTAFVTAIPLSLRVLRKYYTLQDEKSGLEKLNTDLELNFLKSQINPHFLFNTLNNIYSLSLQNSDKAPDMILKLSDLMRYMLYECNVPKIALEKDIQFMRDYIDLEKIRHGEHVNISYMVSGDLKNKYIPPLMLIPFVENSFKHGVNAQLGNAWVKIIITIEDNKLFCVIENNKPSGPPIAMYNAGGIGIENAKKRLNLIYPNKHTLHITSDSTLYKVELSIDKL